MSINAIKSDKNNSNVLQSIAVDNSRRDFFRTSAAGAFGAAALMGLVPNSIKTNAWAAGSDAPEITEVKIGFIPLTDCDIFADNVLVFASNGLSINNSTISPVSIFYFLKSFIVSQ